MIIHGFLVKVLFICIACMSVPCRISAIAISQNEMPTHLVSVDYSAYTYTNNDDVNQPDDTSGQESIKIENRQLYDTVKHASGYDPDAANNNSNNANEETNEKLNSSTVKIYIPTRKSAVIQAIPRKVRGPGNISSSTTTTLSPFARPPSLHATAKDYGTGEPTTTIVYATSIPTTTASRTYVNIRPVPLLSTQKYRSTVSENKQGKNQDTDNTKPVSETFSEDQQQQQHEQKSQVNVLEKPTFKIESNSEQAPTTPRSYETTPYHIEQRKRNLYKSIPYARIRTNEDIDEMPAYNRNAFVNPYPNHKWTNEDYLQRMPPPTPPQFMYENHQNPQQNYYQPPASQNLFSPRYPPPDDYQDEMYRGIPTPSPIYVPHQQPITTILSQQQQRQQYQPLTARDFDLLLQLLVLRERRLHTSQDPYPSSSDYNGGIQQENSYYYDMPKASVPENQYYKNREPKYIENSLPISGQQSSARLLPSNVREELLFRMLLLALHLQPQPKPVPMVRNPPILPPQYMYLGSSSPSSSSPSAASAFLGFRQRTGIPKNPVRSVQVLGEID